MDDIAVHSIDYTTCVTINKANRRLKYDVAFKALLVFSLYIASAIKTGDQASIQTQHSC